MSFKPQLFADGQRLLPLANAQELFILERAKITFQCIYEGKKLKSKGRIYCTTQRIVFVADKATEQYGIRFEAFSIPLVNMTDEKFNQPIFGACSISGKVAAIDEKDIASESIIAWKIIFDNGGTGIVLPVFLRLMDKRHKNEKIDQSFVQTQKKAFLDPNDPTVIYITQPGQ